MDAKFQDIQIKTGKSTILDNVPVFCVRECILQCICFSEKFVIIDYTEKDGIEHEVKIPKEKLRGYKIVID